MDTTLAGAGEASDFELPAPLTFQTVFQSCPDWEGVNQGSIPRVIKQLRRNTRKHSFLMDIDNRQLVLSVLNGKSSLIQMYDHAFDPFMEQASAAGVGPKLIFNSPEQGYLVTEYLEGRCWRSEDFQNMANIERLAKLLKKVHGLPKSSSELNAVEKANNYWRLLQSEYVKQSPRLKALQTRMARVIDYADAHFSEKVVCHSNLLNSQVVETADGLKLVGWECAVINDPFYDLAVIVHNHGFNERQLDQLLFCYAGRNGSYERERFYYSYAIYIYLRALSYLLECAETPKPHQEEEIEIMTDVLVALLHQIGG